MIVYKDTGGGIEYDLSALGFPSTEDALECRVNAQVIKKFVGGKLKKMGF